MAITQEPFNEDPLNFAQQHVQDEAERVQLLLKGAREERSTEQRIAALDELMELHERLASEEETSAQGAEIAFLLLLRDEPEILENPEYREFVANCVDSRTFRNVEWQSVTEVIMVAEMLYGFRFQDRLSPDEITEHVRDMVRHALQQFEDQERSEEMFSLLQQAPIPASMMDAELVRLRNRLHIYEMHRVTRKRRYLYGYLIVQAFLVFLLFPFLFQNVENGALQSQVEAATGLEIVEGEIRCAETEEGTECSVPRQFVNFGDSLYWSVITYGAIGYGDISPLTDVGKILAGLHGLMGVLTTAIVAGLILNWISPRSLEM